MLGVSYISYLVSSRWKSLVHLQPQRKNVTLKNYISSLWTQWNLVVLLLQQKIASDAFSRSIIEVISHWACVCTLSTHVLSGSVTESLCVWIFVCVCAHQLSGCEMAIWGHTSGLVWQWARVIIRSQWDAVLFLPRVRCLSGPVSSHLDGWAGLLRAPAHLPSQPKTNWTISHTQATVTLLRGLSCSEGERLWELLK